MQLRRGVGGAGQAAAAETGRGHPEIAAVFLHHMSAAPSRRRRANGSCESMLIVSEMPRSYSWPGRFPSAGVAQRQPLGVSPYTLLVDVKMNGASGETFAQPPAKSWCLDIDREWVCGSRAARS